MGNGGLIPEGGVEDAFAFYQGRITCFVGDCKAHGRMG